MLPQLPLLENVMGTSGINMKLGIIIYPRYVPDVWFQLDTTKSLAISPAFHVLDKSQRVNMRECNNVCSQEATRLALISGDQATYARSIRIMGDIYRKKSDINVRYHLLQVHIHTYITLYVRRASIMYAYVC